MAAVSDPQEREQLSPEETPPSLWQNIRWTVRALLAPFYHRPSLRTWYYVLTPESAKDAKGAILDAVDVLKQGGPVLYYGVAFSLRQTESRCVRISLPLSRFDNALALRNAAEGRRILAELCAAAPPIAALLGDKDHFISLIHAYRDLEIEIARVVGDDVQWNPRYMALNSLPTEQ